ncbi:MAG TPA: universal stress protein [Bacteroidia bacterium]|jgi:nucleotide-binding universal stress UspA family protein|nr:universal stress protein [Bacteroidia bacterium]
MININTKKILVPVDFSKTAGRAIKHAAFIARLTKGELLLLFVQKKNDLIDIILPAVKLKDTSVITRFLEEKLRVLAEEIRKEYGIKVTPIISLGNITSEIVSIAEENKVGLIVMGTQGGDSINDAFMGSNAYRTLTKSSIPVMTVRSEAPKLGYSNILLPIDSSEHSRQKVNSAIQLADKFASHLYLLGVLGKKEDNYEYKLKVILPQIEKMAKTKNLACTAEIVKAENRAQRTLAYAKKVNADLIIIMADQNAEFSSIVLGSYAHQLINNSRIPVLSIPPEVHGENIPVTLGGLW